MDLGFVTAQELIRELGARLRAQRMALLMTQSELAHRSSVALGSIKKLESSGLTTLETFVRVVQALALTDELANLFALKSQTSIADMQRAQMAMRQRAPRRRNHSS